MPVKCKNGLWLPSDVADPAAPLDGEVWLRADEAILRHRVGGQTIRDTPAATWPAIFAARYVNTAPYASGGTVALTLNKIYAQPFVVPRKTTLDRIYTEVTTAGATGALLRFGLYDSETTGQPVNLLGDYGTQAATAIGQPTATPAAPPTLWPGVVYHAVLVPQGATCTVRSSTGTDPLIQQATAVALGGNAVTAWLSSGATTTGALPAAFGAVTAGQGPRFGLRFT